MRIAFCHHYRLSFCGGGERWITEAANYLRARGHTVQIYCLPFRGRKNFPPLRKDIPYRESWFHSFEADVAYYVYVPWVTSLFRTKAKKILGLHAALHANLTEKVSNPYLFYKRYGPYVTLANSLLKITRKDEFSSFDALHWVSPAEPFVKHQKIFRIPNWIDTKFFEPRKKEKKEFVVLFVGKQTYSKGFDRFLELSHMFRSPISFMSTGQTFENIKGVGFVPYDSMGELYSEASVVVNPSRVDSFGLVIPESLASGVPVITTPIAAHQALDLPLSYANSPIEMAREVKRIYSLWKDNNGEYSKIASLGMESVKKYDAKTILPKIEQMFLEVAEK